MYRGSGTKQHGPSWGPKTRSRKSMENKDAATLRTVEKMFLKVSFLTSKIDMFFGDGVGGLHCSML